MSLFDCVVLALVILAAVWYRWYTFPSSIKKIVESTRPDNDLPGTYHYEANLENCTDGKAHPDTGFPKMDSTILPINISPSYMSIYKTPMKDKHKWAAAKDSVSKKNKAKKKTKKKTSKGKNK